MPGHMVSKAMGKEGKEGQSIEYQDNTYMSSTGSKGLCPGLPRRQLEDCSQDYPVGHGDENKVQPCSEKSSSEPINAIKGNAIASQLGDAHVLTVGMADDVALAEVQTENQEDTRGNYSHTPSHQCQGHLANERACK